MSPALTPIIASPDTGEGRVRRARATENRTELNKGRVSRAEARQSFDGERRATMLAVCFCGLATPRSEPRRGPSAVLAWAQGAKWGEKTQGGPREYSDKRRSGNAGRLRKGQWPDGSHGFATVLPGPFATYGDLFYANGNTTFICHRERPRLTAWVRFIQPPNPMSTVPVLVMMMRDLVRDRRVFATTSE